MNQFDVMRKFKATLSAVREWIDTTLEQNRPYAVPVISLGFQRLAKVLPLDLLTKAQVVAVTGNVPFPPLSRMGLPEFSEMENMLTQMQGVTYKDTFFVKRLHRTESLHFHEMVHVVQWERLGIDHFLLAYGAGLMQSGYQNSPLEKMAYSLQTAFDHDVLPVNIIEFIQRSSDTIWDGVAPMF